VGEHGLGGPSVSGLLTLVVGLAAAAVYLAAVRRDARRRSWPRGRTVAWLSGVVVLLVGSAGPVAEAAQPSFTAHAAGHVLVGMLGPLLLVLGAPVTLALRVLPVNRARQVTRVLNSRLARVLTEPLVAATLTIGGLWLLYTTALFALAQHHPGVHLLVHLHLVVAGYLLPATLVGPDPLPHRRPFTHRAAVLVAAWAAHGIVAKYLWTRPPLGLDPTAVETGAMVMYYGGDLVEVVVAVLLCQRWFADRRRGPAALQPA